MGCETKEKCNFLELLETKNVHFRDTAVYITKGIKNRLTEICKEYSTTELEVTITNICKSYHNNVVENAK